MKIRSIEELPSFEYFDSRLHYDAETGLLTWKRKTTVSRDKRRWNSRYSGKVAGTRLPIGYIVLILDDTSYQASRVAWLLHYGTHPDGEVDHIDTDKTNNRIGNLRLADRHQNLQNIGKYSLNTSGYKGVHWVKAMGQWLVRITVNGERIPLGYFPKDQLEEAGECYKQAAIKYHGEFART